MGYTSLPNAEAAAATALADDDDDDDGGGGARGEAIVRGSRRGRTCLVQRQINHRVAFGALLPHSIVVATSASDDNTTTARGSSNLHHSLSDLLRHAPT